MNGHQNKRCICHRTWTPSFSDSAVESDATLECLLSMHALPIFHASLHALLTGRGHTLNRELSQTARHHCHSSELAAGARAGAVGILTV